MTFAHACNDTEAACYHESALESDEYHSDLGELFESLVSRIFVAGLIFDVPIPGEKDKSVHDDENASEYNASLPAYHF